jgi:hypothetical protein
MTVEEFKMVTGHFPATLKNAEKHYKTSCFRTSTHFCETLSNRRKPLPAGVNDTTSLQVAGANC